MARFETTLNTQALPDGKTNVLIRIFHQGNTAYLATDMFIEPDSFNQSTGRVVKGPNMALFNRHLSDIVGACQQAYWEIPGAEALTAYQISDRLVNAEGMKAFGIRSRIGTIEL